jgi:hypothetical protein
VEVPMIRGVEQARYVRAAAVVKAFPDQLA